jgi:predicted metal-dependent enzyme (double-stranded beta helix superfamily)
MPTLTAPLSTQLTDLVTGLAACPAMWKPHVVAAPGRRHFHRLVSSADATVWLISWMPGTDTGYHDHDGAAGAVCVVAGAVLEERPRLGALGALGAVHGEGDVFTFGPHDIHRVQHADGEPAVTIHGYSPALRRMGRYSEGPNGVLLREPLDEDTELVAV